MPSLGFPEFYHSMCNVTNIRVKHSHDYLDWQLFIQLQIWTTILEAFITNILRIVALFCHKYFLLNLADYTGQGQAIRGYSLRLTAELIR